MDQTESAAPVELGRRIRTLRVKLGLKQQDLASSDISASYISLIESGKRAPSDAVLSALAGKLGCSPDHLRTGRDDHALEDTRLKLSFAEMALRNGDNGEALQAFGELLAKPALLDPHMRLRARIGQATSLEKLDRIEAAIPVLEELGKDPSLAAGSDEWCRVQVALSRCYRNMGDITLGIEIGERAMARLDALGLDVTVDHIQVGATLIGSYLMRGDITRAHLLAQKLVPVAEDHGGRAGRGAVYWNAGLVALSRRQLPEALALTERALAMMADDDNLRHVAMLKMTVAWLELQSDVPDPARALELLQDAGQTLAELGTAVEQARCEICLIDANTQLGRWDEAVSHARRALGLLSSGPRVEAVGARVRIAEIHLLRGETEEGLQGLHAATRQLRHFAASYETAQEWRHLGDVWKRQGRAKEALDAYDQALQASGMPTTYDPAQALTGQQQHQS
ncbi:helix-turn-helix domain-containing protein [Streptomyces sp. NRRL S-646]|uniref:helix-turn-helix domain-containing protein n=1 Tax=Streptomyces sp. NRRL S-646 TaxID=1463917 RepID=UPI0004C7A55B|nr:helix-turn-helix domain-containing protein [Streptomyces sp. NRRL S-646]